MNDDGFLSNTAYSDKCATCRNFSRINTVGVKMAPTPIHSSARILMQGGWGGGIAMLVLQVRSSRHCTQFIACFAHNCVAFVGFFLRRRGQKYAPEEVTKYFIARVIAST